jgi:hypothetical protein
MCYRSELHAWLWKHVFGDDALADIYGNSNGVNSNTSTAAVATSGRGFGRTLHGATTAATASYAKEVEPLTVAKTSKFMPSVGVQHHYCW